MATLIFVDQENGEVGAPKSQLRLPAGSCGYLLPKAVRDREKRINHIVVFIASSGAKILSERAQVNTPLPKKAISASPALSRSVRKALGNVNRTEGVSSKMDNIKQKIQPCTANKTTEKTGLESCSSVAEEDWPEIENMFPFDPQDFENFDLPEENKISNINLCGVPLMMFERTYDRRVNMVPSPVEMEEFSWESNLLQSTTDFLATLDEIIDMPPPNYDL